MKVKSIFVLLLLSTVVQAGVLPGQYPVERLNQMRQCSVQECRLDDGGVRFVNYCNSTIPPMNGWLRTLDIYVGANFSCYCPCRLDFIDAIK